jgi:hypothetical protein
MGAREYSMEFIYLNTYQYSSLCYMGSLLVEDSWKSIDSFIGYIQLRPHCGRDSLGHIIGS